MLFRELNLDDHFIIQVPLGYSQIPAYELFVKVRMRVSATREYNAIRLSGTYYNRFCEFLDDSDVIKVDTIFATKINHLSSDSDWIFRNSKERIYER